MEKVICQRPPRKAELEPLWSAGAGASGNPTPDYNSTTDRVILVPFRSSLQDTHRMQMLCVAAYLPSTISPHKVVREIPCSLSQ